MPMQWFTDTEPRSLSKGYVFLTEPEKGKLRDRRTMGLRSFSAAACFPCALCSLEKVPARHRGAKRNNSSLASRTP
ncbi:hypothetical protein IscW_ISCW007273 [Ixodes scapularis]|uniref:Uncharacterized protein n=1 Tax=Ixodes scapularis TaxID=6945 RepID=B7PSC6_IXOSC|nr:hypothetical protein IscW_ISCW007273 [Ixodes scapularis]|eukprot:XP_002402188.1 hypothetical protein IscW_ISCW007273 [Ixodes scapularis]